MISFEWLFIFYLLPLPYLVYKLLPEKKQLQASLYMPLIGERDLTQSHQSGSQFSWLTALLLILIWISLLAAAAKPIMIGEAIELPSNGRDLLLAVDISGSMHIEDMSLNGKKVDRLTLVKNVVDDFIIQRQGDRLGLILFGTNAYIQAPLTFDLATISNLLHESHIGFAGDGTAIGDAIGLSIKRLANNPADSRIVILITDGQNTAGAVKPLQAAQLAQQENVIIYTIGIGSDKPIKSGFFGLNSYNPSRDLDEKSLKAIANATYGQYFRARNQKELNSIYATIDKLEAIEQEAEVFRPTQSLFHWPLGAMLILCLLLVASKQLSSSVRGPK